MRLYVDNEEQVLYQYDKGQRLILDGFADGIRLDIARCGDKNAISEFPYTDGGVTYCDVPDILLMSAVDLVVYVRQTDGDREDTFHIARIQVIPTPRPDGYVEPEDIPVWFDLQTRVEDLENAEPVSVTADGDAIVITTKTAGGA